MVLVHDSDLMHMKTKYTLFLRGAVYYSQDTATGQQKSLRTRDETETHSLLNAMNEAQRQPVLNLHLARAYLTASDPTFAERTWQMVMEPLKERGNPAIRSFRVFGFTAVTLPIVGCLW
jgi:hypothetical protein